MNKIRLVIPLKLPSMNEIQGANRFSLIAKRKKWYEQITLAIRSQPSSQQLKYFKDRLGGQGIHYAITITARLFTAYDQDNCFVKWAIDGLKGTIITDDSLKHIGEPIVVQEIIDVKRIGTKKAGTLRYIDRQTGKRTYPETIIEVELLERNPVMLL